MTHMFSNFKALLTVERTRELTVSFYVTGTWSTAWKLHAMTDLALGEEKRNYDMIIYVGNDLKYIGVN